MASVEDICNIALQAVGATSISDINEGSVEADECLRRYSVSRRGLLESYYWDFATRRVGLNKLTTTPSWGYSNEFALPNDYVRMFCTQEQYDTHSQLGGVLAGIVDAGFGVIPPLDDDYAIEVSETTLNKVLRCDDDSKNILYIFDNDRAGSFSPLFVEYLAMKMADGMAYRFEASSGLMDRIGARMTEAKNIAEHVQANNSPKNPARNSVFIGVRG